MAVNNSQFAPYPVAANGTRIVVAASDLQGSVHGFLCGVSGTMRIGLGIDGLGADLVSSTPVTAGSYYPLPMTIPGTTPCAMVLAGGAAGTIFMGE